MSSAGWRGAMRPSAVLGRKVEQGSSRSRAQSIWQWKKQSTQPGRPFRRYRLAGGWEVWVGRNNRENDELTHRAAAPGDLWFHAQGVPGSHVVLRTGGRPEQVPGRVREQAAALAALHSRARHSSLVPVIWTQRRYVRKPRRSPPGTAVCIREKSLFVAPGIPEGAEQE